MQIKTAAILALAPITDHSGKEGHFVEPSGAGVEVVNSATDIPLGVILDGEVVGGRDSVAIPGGFPGTCHVKLGSNPGAVVRGAYGVLNDDGTVKLDPGEGARVRVCRFLESGAADELVEAVLIDPVAIPAAE